MANKTFKIVNGDISDGYHTFDELYRHRNLLFIALLNEVDGRIPTCWIKNHYPGWDLLLLRTEKGDITYHVPADYRHFYDSFDRLEIEDYEYDGHTSDDVINRLVDLIVG